MLLAARDRDTWEAVRTLCRERAVDKRYWALVSGPIADQGAIELPLRHKGETRVEAALDGGEVGREALSEFRVLARKGELSLVEVRISPACCTKSARTWPPSALRWWATPSTEASPCPASGASSCTRGP